MDLSVDLSEPSRKPRTLTDIANDHGTDKGTAVGDWGTSHNYTQVYDALLRERRNEPLNVLEIGVWRGASLRMWEEYLPNANIVGLDILPDTLKQASDRSRVLIGDAADPSFLRRVVATAFQGPIDLIVDDGSHALDHQVTALKTLFPFLAENGLYVVEDTAVSRFGLKVVNVAPFMDFHDYAAELAAQTTFFADAPHDKYNTVHDVNALNDLERREIAPSYWNSWLYSVSFFYNMCVFAKRERVLSVPAADPHEWALELPSGAAWRARVAKERLAEAPLDDRAGEILHRTADALDNVAIKVGVAAALGRHCDSPPEALAETVSSLDDMLAGFRRQVSEAKRESSRSAVELRESRSAFERAVARLAKAEAEVEYLRQELSTATRQASPTAEPLVEGDMSAGIEKHSAEPVASAGLAESGDASAAAADALNTAKSADRMEAPASPPTVKQVAAFQPTVMGAKALVVELEDPEAKAAEVELLEAARAVSEERILELENQLIQNAAELAQIRLIHGGLWEAHQYVAAELETCRRDAACVREDLYRERAESGHLIWLAERRIDEFEGKLGELTGFTRWLREEKEAGAGKARADLQSARQATEDIRTHSGRLEAERDDARREVEASRADSAAILASASWRLTAPLRWVRSRWAT